MMSDPGARRELRQEIAATIRHQLNNPLAALLAEAQLLELDPELQGAQRESVERLIALIRRTIGTVRGLDGESDSMPR